ncbi:MAG: Lsr2 family protein [Propionibacterium sp.]|nr:Lsr2 family protein [Propionibacterium sp.]
MARRVEVTLIDDISGEEASRTFEFSVEGQNYEIDLTEANIEKFNKAVAEFVDNARRVRGARRRATRSAGRSTATESATGVNPADVRRWATSQGIEVSERGRIPKDVQAAYVAAHA